MERRPVIQSASETKCVNHKVLIIGDSQARNSVSELQHRLGSTFAVSGFVKQGAGMTAIVHTVKDYIMKLKSDYVIVILGVSNETGKNYSREAMKHL